MLRRIHVKAIVCATMAIGLSPPLRAGPYSTGTLNTKAGAVDPAIPGFVNGSVNPAFVGWTTGFSSYLPAPGVDSSWGSATLSLGPVTGLYYDIVSLGDLNSTQLAAGASPGQITLSFKGGIRNGAGADFAVFENALDTTNTVFGELAYVEASSDGVHFARFPSFSLTPNAVGTYNNIDPTNVYNLAGKHVNSNGKSWGTPFNLSDLSTSALVASGQLKLNGVKYIRLIDIPGDGSSLDSTNHPIYDPWLTFGSGGFDLEAVGVTNNWLAGDANFDGIVNVADLTILAAHWNQSGMDFPQGDFDLNGWVNITDLFMLAKNWQSGSGALSASLASLSLPQVAVPEPSFVALVSAAFLCAARRRGRN